MACLRRRPNRASVNTSPLTMTLPTFAPLRADKSLGMRDYPGQSGTIRDKTPVFAVVFGRRRGQMGIKTFVSRFSPIRRFSRGLGTVLTSGKACLKGRARRPDLSPIVDTPRNTPYFNDPQTPGNRGLKAI